MGRLHNVNVLKLLQGYRIRRAYTIPLKAFSTPCRIKGLLEFTVKVAYADDPYESNEYAARGVSKGNAFSGCRGPI